MTSVFGIFAAFLILNLIFWIFFLVAFKKRYSPENVLGKIKEEVDQIEMTLVQHTSEITDDISRQKREIRMLMRQIDERLKILKLENEKEKEAAEVEKNLRGQSPILRKQDDFAFAEKASVFAQNAKILQNQENSEPSEAERIVRLYENGFESGEIAEKLGLPIQQVAIVLNAEKMRRGK